MTQVLQCRCDEGVRLNPDRIVALYAELGPVGAEQVISAAMEDLAVQLSIIEKVARGGEADDLRRAVAAMVPLARQVGMEALARIADDLLGCVARGDGAATGAVLARLMRLGDRSLTAVWDLSDMRI